MTLFVRNKGGKMPGSNWYNEKALKEMDMKKYSRILSKLIEDKVVYVFPAEFSSYWVEAPLCDWLIENYAKLGYSEVVCEYDKENYFRLKHEMGFKLQPDFIVKKDGDWLRLEVECWSHAFNYNHNEEYCEIVFCYDYTGDIPSNIELITLREVLGCEYIINRGEIFQFLDLYCPDFHEEYGKKWASAVMGVKLLNWKG